MILGFDPRYQFVHEDDVVHSLEHVVQRELPGVFNVAGDGVLALSEVAGLLNKPYAPILPPWGTGLATGVLQAPGRQGPARDAQPAALRPRAGQPPLKAAGFRYGHTSRETVLVLGEHLRLHPLLRSGAQEPYRYEREVEEFLRWSPHVRGSQTRSTPTLSTDQVSELQRAAGGPRRAGGRGRARAGGRPAGARSRAGRPSRCRPPPEPEPEPEPGPRPSRPSTTTTTWRPRRSSRCWAPWSRRTCWPCATTSAATRGREPVVGAIESVLARRGQSHVG